ncbi:uncharacterized protein MKK02DRAFT_28082 [Dioszegia hungarica]|uniref:SAP domain-containing protein n=1 Tax=Dioszegia hungarica TaxID=4972 RepID=A0AA38H9D7_9TREE|nr:uncharacterized protein MKK02DRAFT_28082 [Dioszegia hungarica]KAI9634976.1 hypothetical protein MKK02DRAFT_28082 [Dioszegia hungarica]
MLRRKLSAGALRATSSPISSLTSSVPGQSMANAARHGQQGQQIQSANLASAVLLNSQRRWREETVVTLKSELKRRGLSQTGNKTALVTRLESADTSSFLPPVPALPAHPQKRTLSTASPARQAKSSPPAPAAPTKPEGAAQDPIQSEAVTSTGPAVISQKMEAAKTEAIEPDVVDSVPGLPELTEIAQEQQAKGSAGDGMSMSMPSFEETPEVEQVIPLEPDNFRSNRELPEADAPPTSSDVPSGPKVVTVADQTSTPSGGPSHAAYDDLPTPPSAEEAAAAASEAADKLIAALPSLGSVLTTIAHSPIRAVTGVASVLPPIGMPKGELKAENKEYKANSEPLDKEEKRGMYIFGGIVALGLALGGDWSGKGKGKKGDHGKDGKGLKGKVGELVEGAKGVKGDKEWEKASGAGVVGHGARKA